jgi:hypothetical protein
MGSPLLASVVDHGGLAHAATPVLDRVATARTAILRPLTADKLSSVALRLDARIEALERLTADEPDGNVRPDRS